MATRPPIIKFISYEEYLNMQKLVGSDVLSQFELADSIVSIYEMMEFGASYTPVADYR